MRYILLLLDGTCAEISQEDAELQRFNWSRDERGYIVRRLPRNNHSQKKVYLHRQVMSRATGIDDDNLPVIEHLNDNPNDNRRENLRLSTQTANALRSSVNRQRGACWCEPRKCWTVQIAYAGRTIHLGGFKDKQLADVLQQEARESLLRLVESSKTLTVEDVFYYFKGDDYHG